MAAMPEYPYTPTTGREMEIGDWWDIITDDVYGFGVCVGTWNKAGILAAFLYLTKKEPTLTEDDDLGIAELGHMQVRSIPYCGGLVRGNITLDISHLHATHRTIKINEPRMIIRKAKVEARKQSRKK